MWDDIAKALLGLAAAYTVAWLQGTTRRRLLRQEIVGDLELIEKLGGRQPATARLQWRVDTGLARYAHDPRDLTMRAVIKVAAIEIVAVTVIAAGLTYLGVTRHMTWWVALLVGSALGGLGNVGLRWTRDRTRERVNTYRGP